MPLAMRRSLSTKWFPGFQSSRQRTPCSASSRCCSRIAPPTAGSIHERYDTPVIVSPEQVVVDTEFIAGFTGRMANAVRCPVKREIPEKIKDKLDVYLNRKRPPKAQD